jgi:hypothetical protein
MRAKIGGCIAIIVGIVIVVGFLGTQDREFQNTEKRVFHVTLADPKNYENGVYSDSFEIEEGMYEFRFVPNGDSPKILTISMNGESLGYYENFSLEGTPHETGVSTYYTWEYSGNKTIMVPSKQEIEIIINPNGNLLGPVSVDIIKNK